MSALPLACAAVTRALDLNAAPPSLKPRALIVVQVVSGVARLLMLARGMLTHPLSRPFPFVAGLLLAH